MPSKLRKAIGAVKDRTSISFAKVASNASDLEVAILRATSHDEIPMEERHVVDILRFVSSNKFYASVCAHAIGRRIGRTRNWVVALKSLMLVLRIFQDGDPYFPREVLHAMKRGAKILNLANFRDDSSSSAWEYTAFVRLLALYLDERLECFLTGKLQRRYTNREDDHRARRQNLRRIESAVRDVKPVMLLDKVSYWQRLLDRAISTRPTGEARSNKLVRYSLYEVVRESFELYKDISDGLALLLDSFFHLQHQSCVQAFKACTRASDQFEELNEFYDMCKSNGVGRTSEYPSVQKISAELIETLEEFLKDQSSFPATGISSSQIPPAVISSALLLPSSLSVNSSSVVASGNRGESFDTVDVYSDQGSCIISLEDLMNMNGGGTSPSVSSRSEPHPNCRERNDSVIAFDAASVHSLPSEIGSNLRDNGFDAASTNSLPNVGSNPWAVTSVSDSASSHSRAGSNQTLDLFLLDDRDHVHRPERNSWELMLCDERDKTSGNWELVLEQTVTKPVVSSRRSVSELPGRSLMDDIWGETMVTQPQKPYNPFLDDLTTVPALEQTPTENYAIVPWEPDFFTVNPQPAPTFQTMTPPTFRAQSSRKKTVKFVDPFSGVEDTSSGKGLAMDQGSVLRQQQLWLQNQRKIMANRLS